MITTEDTTMEDRRDNRPKGRPRSKQATALHYAGMAQIARWDREANATGPISDANALAKRIGTLTEINPSSIAGHSK